MTFRHVRHLLCGLVAAAFGAPAFLAHLLAPALVAADHAGPPVIVVPGGVFRQDVPVTVECWAEPHYFDSLRTGPIEYCRKNLRFRRGALECLTISDRVCTVWYPDRREWGRNTILREARLIRCPPEEPPTCPRLGVPRQSRARDW